MYRAIPFMESDPVYSQYISGDERKIVELLELGFGEWPSFNLNCSSLAHWRWKYNEVPIGESFIVKVMKGSEIVAALHAYPVEIKVKDKIYLCTYAGDNVVHPDYREQGISNMMYKEMIELKNSSGVVFDYFVTSTPYLIESWSKRFYIFPFTISNLVWIEDIDLQLKEMPVKHPFLVKLGFLASKTLNSQRHKESSKTKKANLNLEAVEEFDERIDRFWDKISKCYDFIVERSSIYLNWRYCDERSGDLKQIESGKEILGFCVYGINNKNPEYPVGYILDLLALPGEKEAVNVLIQDGLRYFKERKVNLVNCLMPRGHTYYSLLKQHGFLDSRVELKLFLRLHPERTSIGNIVASLSPDRIHFTYGDIDSMPSRVPKYI